jgi:hypothetical protein
LGATNRRSTWYHEHDLMTSEIQHDVPADAMLVA